MSLPNPITLLSRLVFRPHTKVSNFIPTDTSSYARVVPVVFGTNRIAANVIWLPSTGVSFNGGVSYARVALALCEGPIDSVGRVWRDKAMWNSLANFNTGQPAWGGGQRVTGVWTLHLGTRPQAVDQIVTSTDTGPAQKQITLAFQRPPPTTQIVYLPEDASSVIEVHMQNSVWAGTPQLPIPFDFVAPRTLILHLDTVSPAGGWTQQAYPLFLTYMSAGLPAASGSLGYGGTAYVITADLNIGADQALGNFTFEVTGFGATNGGEASPSFVIGTMLCDPNVGLGVETARVETVLGLDGSVATGLFNYATAQVPSGVAALDAVVPPQQFLISPVFDAEKPTRDHLQLVMSAVNTDVRWADGGKLHFVPLGDQSVDIYTAFRTPQFDIGPDHIEKDANGSITIERTSDADAFNVWPIEYCERYPSGSDIANIYTTSVVEEPEQADVVATGLMKRAPATPMPCITNAVRAQRLSRILAQRSCYERNTYKFRVSLRFMHLEPLDFVTLTEPKMGLNRRLVRIKTIEEDAKGTLTIEATEAPGGMASAALHDIQTGEGGGYDPGLVNTPAYLDSPLDFVLG